MKKVVVVLAMSFLLAMGSIVYAEGHGMTGDGAGEDFGFMGKGHGVMGGHRLWGELMDLGLDEKQKDAVKEILRKTKRANISKRADLDIARIDLRELLDNDAVDMKAVESKLKQIASIETEIHLARITAYEKIKPQLTPDQRKKLREAIDQKMTRGKPGLFHGRGCGMRGHMIGDRMNRGYMYPAMPSAETSDVMPGMHRGY